MKARGKRGGAPGRRASAEPDLFGPVDPRAYDRRAARRAPAETVREPMTALGDSPATAVSVSALTTTARDVVEGAFLPLWVRGEVTDFKRHRSGHWYFCLRDERAQARCVVWSRDQRRIPAAPDDGMQVSALGQLTVYAARGEMHLVVTRLEAAGDGLRRKALERAAERLRAEGLLAPERKRVLPRYPRRIAVVTSPDGAALHDVIAVIRRRCPIVEIVLVAARVQGEGAPDDLRTAIERVSRWGKADAVIIGRGGGARDDLWAFNDERVARAIAACAIPTISAVGHEVDVTLCDLVADVRAPTPSAAAEAAVPVLGEMRASLAAAGEALRVALERRVHRASDHLARGAHRLRDAARRDVERRRTRIERTAATLHALSPLATLARGYAVARAPDGRPLTRAADFPPARPFSLVLHDGQVEATVDDHPPASRS